LALEDIASRLQALHVLAGAAEADVAKVHETLRDLVRVFEGLAENAQAFMAGVARSIELQQAAAEGIAEARLAVDVCEGALKRASETLRLAGETRAVAKELQKRPTSTGVRYRLLWQPLSEDQNAPVGLDVARQRLFNTNADLWSIEDRQVIGAMLQRRISAERQRADQIGANAGSGALLAVAAALLDDLAVVEIARERR
jgi:hypothetical protein